MRPVAGPLCQTVSSQKSSNNYHDDRSLQNAAKCYHYSAQKLTLHTDVFVPRARRPCTMTDPPNYFIRLLSAAKALDLVL